MAHNLYREKFYTMREPAWHGLGLVSQVPMSAMEIGDKLGLPQVYCESIQTAQRA